MADARQITLQALNTSTAQVAANDTLEDVAGKLQGQINGFSMPGLQTETQNYRSRIIAAGGSIDAATLFFIDKFIVRGKNDGWWSAIKQCWIPCGDFAASKVFLVTPAGITPVFNNFVATDYTLEGGYILTANTNKYIDTGFVPNSNGLTYLNFMMGMSTTYDASNTTLPYLVGCTPPVTTTKPSPFADTNGGFGLDGRNMAFNGGGENINVVAHYGSSATGSSLNGVLQSSTASATTSVTMDSAVTLFRTQRENSTIYFAKGGIGLWLAGSDITDAQTVSLNLAMMVLMAAVRKYTAPMIAFGDSITAGTASSFHPKSWPRQLARKLGLRELNAGRGSSAVNASQSIGTNTVLAAITSYTYIAAMPNATVAMLYGTNDIGLVDGATSGTQSIANTYSTNLSTIIAAFLTANHRVIVGCPPWRGTSADATKLTMYAVAAAAAAKSNKVPFADLLNAIIDNGMNNTTYFADNLHPNDAGHQLIAEYMYEASLGRLVRKPTLDFPSIAANSQADLTVTVYNAVAGMSVDATPLGALEAGLVPFAFVSANDTVTVRLTNTTGAAIDPASLQYKVTVFVNY